MLPVSSDTIRAVLGVTAEELEDATLALPIYEYVFDMEVEEISSDLKTAYTTAEAVPTPRPTNTQRLVQVYEVFAAYSVARHLLTSLKMFAPKVITDGQAEVERVVDPFSSTKDAVNQTYDIMRTRLVKAYNLYANAVLPVPGTASFVTARAVGLAVDPVTGS